MITPATSRSLVAILIISLFAPSLTFAQTAQENKSADTRIQDLINARKSAESWSFWETQLALTPAPRSQPIEALPEWYPAGSVILTLDDDYVESFKLNNAFGTQNMGREITRHDAKAIEHVRSITCNTLYTSESETSDLLRHSPEASARIKQLCQGSSKSERTLANQNPEDAPLIALMWLERLEEDEVLNLLSYAHSFLRILGDLTAHTDVVVQVRGLGLAEDAIHQKIELMKSFPNGRTLLSSKRIQFVQVPVRTKWVRDYGPIFVKDSNRQIIVVDPRYETERQSLEQSRELARMKGLLKGLLKQQQLNDTKLKKGMPEFDTGESGKVEAEASVYRETRLFDDVSPSLLAAHLRQRNKDSLLPYPINVVRPPLALAGGDFFTDGKGVGFTSTETLRSNGGNVELVNHVFREYFGIKDVVYLQPLPGSTVKHIDMFFKPVTDKILLLGKFEGPGVGAYASNLQAEAQRVLSYNLRILKDFYSNRKDQDHPTEVNVVEKDTDEIKPNVVNIVLVPMPDLRRPVREKLDKAQQDLTSLREKYEQQSKALKKAQADFEILDQSIEFLIDDVDTFTQAVAELRTPPAADTEPVSVFDLTIATTDVMLEVEAFHQITGQTVDKASLALQLKPLTDLDTFLDPKDVDALIKDFSLIDKRALEPLLKGAAAACHPLLTKMSEARAKAREDRSAHLRDLKKINTDIDNMSKRFETLRQLFPQGSDLYRTFLNALQVRTNQTNLLLLPVYKGVDELEQRVQNTLRRVYTQAYGSVTIIPVDSDYFIQLSGSIHCLTQMIPAEVEVFPDDWNYRSRLAAIP